MLRLLNLPLWARVLILAAVFSAVYLWATDTAVLVFLSAEAAVLLAASVIRAYRRSRN